MLGASQPPPGLRFWPQGRQPPRAPAEPWPRPPRRPHASRIPRAESGASLPETLSIWGLLGLQIGASKREIRKKYKKYIRTHHPDVKGTTDPEFVEKFTCIHESYKAIMSSDDDLFWVECWQARAEQISATRQKAWDRRRTARAAAAAAAGTVREAPEPWPTEGHLYILGVVVLGVGSVIAFLSLWLGLYLVFSPQTVV